MARHTQQELIAAALVARGYEEIPSTSKKFRSFISPTAKIFWVGKAGAVRAGRIVTESYPIVDALRRTLVVEGRVLLSPFRAETTTEVDPALVKHPAIPDHWSFAPSQGKRLWGFRKKTSRDVFVQMVEAGFFRRTTA